MNRVRPFWGAKTEGNLSYGKCKEDKLNLCWGAMPWLHSAGASISHQKGVFTVLVPCKVSSLQQEENQYSCKCHLPGLI